MTDLPSFDSNAVPVIKRTNKVYVQCVSVCVSVCRCVAWWLKHLTVDIEFKVSSPTISHWRKNSLSTLTHAQLDVEQ